MSGATTLDELGLSSLERVELMVALEDRFQTRIDEGRFSEVASIADLKQLVEAPAGHRTASRSRSSSRRGIAPWPVRLVRRLSQATWIVPLTRAFAYARVDGLEHLRGLDGPVVFASNHQSHMDVPVILSALPGRWRARVAPAMAKEFFKAHFFPAEHTWRRVVHQLAELLSGGVLLQRVSAAAARGRRTPDAEVHRRADREGLVDPDLSRRACDRRPDR